MAWGKGVKVSACAIALSMLGAGWGGAVSAAELPGHWAQDTLNAWVNKGWLAGAGSGGLQPDQPVTRAEFATLAVRAFGLQADGAGAGNYSDVREGSWYAGAINVAASAGILSGYPDGTIRPSRSVTREEAAVVLAKLDGLTETGAAEPAFSDASDVRSWSKASVGSAVYSKLLGGYPDGTFRPAKAMTRAEAVVALDKAWALRERTRTTVYDKAGVYGPAEGTQEIAGSVSIAAPGVTLRNTVVRGDLTIGAEVGEGDAQLEGVTVDGKLTVAGGGEHSVHLSDAKLGQVVVNKLAGKLRLVLEGTTFITQLDFRSQGLLIVPPGSSVGSLNVYAIIFVTGSGKINSAHLYVSGSSFEQAPGSVEREAGVLLQGETGSTGGNASSGGPVPTPAPTPTPSPSEEPSASPSPSEDPSPSPSPSDDPSPSPSPSDDPSPSPSPSDDPSPSPSPSDDPSPSPSPSEDPSPSPSPSDDPSPSPSPSEEPTPTPGPVINGVKDEMTYTAAVTPELGEGSDITSVELTKDGELVVDYELGGELSETGTYVLTAKNAAGGETVIHFRLSADVKLEMTNYTYEDETLTVHVSAENDGLDLTKALNGVELTLPGYEGDELYVDYVHEYGEGSFTMNRIEETDRFAGHFPEEAYSFPNGLEFHIQYSVWIGRSTVDRDISFKAWVTDASVPENENAIFTLTPEPIHVEYDYIGEIGDLAVYPSEENGGSQVLLTFTQPLGSKDLWIFVNDGTGNGIAKWPDVDLEWTNSSVLVKNLEEGVDYEFQLIVVGGYNDGGSNTVQYTALPLPPPLEPSE
ncbi:S-layer homology domain-containing protein [Cohnella sp. OV330]|uniref:S-layer homology domain-containing protein n=1 Tax=Cohnella sp. OV330 TaxID=1855288 RepID=UPI0008EB337A|nr:S-layer homology domain-containing protein [Cohnella sp. OV330]SFA80806.1 S-layer homology domain-containing protein [Cohnella sp. OV330]